MYATLFLFFTILSLLMIIYEILIYIKHLDRHVRCWSTPPLSHINPHPHQTVVYSSYNKSYYEDPKKKFIKLNEEIVNNFCVTHACIHKKFIHPDDFMSPYWLRVYDLYNLCNTHPNNTLIMYLDADAVVLRSEISVSDFIDSIDALYSNRNSHGDIYISEDPNMESNVMYDGIFNTGCFIVRNTPKSRQFIKEWLSLYNTDYVWSQNAKGEWECSKGSKKCGWSSDGYEQGEFSKLYRKNKTVIQWLHHTTLACTNPYNNKTCYVLHLMGQTDTYREKMFTRLLGNGSHPHAF